jgi:hypothetical protein
VLRKLIAVRAGVFTSLSAAPDVPRESARYFAPDIHRFGGALSVGGHASGYDLSIGVTGLLGRGDAQAYDLTSSAMPYQRTQVRDATLFIFVTGMRNAISKLAIHAQEKLGIEK